MLEEGDAHGAFSTCVLVASYDKEKSTELSPDVTMVSNAMPGGGQWSVGLCHHCSIKVHIHLQLLLYCMTNDPYPSSQPIFTRSFCLFLRFRLPPKIKYCPHSVLPRTTCVRYVARHQSTSTRTVSKTRATEYRSELAKVLRLQFATRKYMSSILDGTFLLRFFFQIQYCRIVSRYSTVL